ncbi:MAG: protein-(glutamine-N5) methyltransferase, release factor-specific [Pseudomonadota bacterium]|jgi:release factor glutamine methyltransferase
MSDDRVPSALEKYFQDFSAALPQHELELFLEAAFHREFPRLPRLTRSQLYSGDRLIEGDWMTQARIWAEKRRAARVPLQHLVREQCFYGRYFEVGPEVLIPRPETEVLVEAVLSWISRQPVTGRSLVGAEIGTGSGVIPVTLALECPSPLRLFATEVSPEALFRAQRNAELLRVPSQSIEWVEVIDPSDVLQTLQSRLAARSTPLDFIVSNPPYLRNDASEVESEVARFEPPQSLFAPEQDLLYYYREISLRASLTLRPGGRVFLEIPHERALEIRALFEGSYEDLRILKDLSGRNRVLEARVK